MTTHVQSDKEATMSRFIQWCVWAKLYEWIQLQAFLTRQSMNSIVLATVAAYRIEVKAGWIVLEHSTL